MSTCPEVEALRNHLYLKVRSELCETWRSKDDPYGINNTTLWKSLQREATGHDKGNQWNDFDVLRDKLVGRIEQHLQNKSDTALRIMWLDTSERDMERDHGSYALSDYSVDPSHTLGEHFPEPHKMREVVARTLMSQLFRVASKSRDATIENPSASSSLLR